MANPKLSEAATRAVNDFEEARKHHDLFRKKADERYRAYRGILETRSEAAQWTSKQHPPLILQVVETTVANIIDSAPRMRIRPRPRSISSGDFQRHIAGCKAIERLLAYEFDVDRFAEKQRTYVLQGLITGLSVGKCYWKSQEGTYRDLRSYQPYAPISNHTVREELEGTGYLHDDPCFEPIDVRDFFWHEGAVDIDSAAWLGHRVWKTYDELKEMEKAGIYSNVDVLKESRQMDDRLGREEDLFHSDRTKDKIEVIEMWYRQKGEVITIGNRSQLLRHQKKWPFHHGQYPFIATSSIPDLFRIPGISQVELLTELQEMLWTLMNQRLDNLSLINNAIILIRSDVDDPDAFEFAPLEKWIVDDIEQVKMWTPEPQAAEISIQAEKMLRGDIQNVTGAGLFASGTESQTIDQKTATGVSIITSLAQRLLAAKKQNYLWAFDKVGDQFIALLQQFMREDRAIQIVGKDGVSDFLSVSPEEIQGRYTCVTELVSESLMRQERRAEAQAKLQVSLAAAPIMQAVGQPLNMRAFMEDFLDAFDALDKERYFASASQPTLGPQGQGQIPGTPGLPSPQGPGGVTAPQAMGPTSPSNQVSQSPEVFLQRALASRGAGRNF